MIKKSLTRKLIVVFSVILIAVVILNLVINGLLLTKVYRDNQINTLKNLYFSLANEFNKDDENNRSIEIIKNTLANKNLRIFVWDSYNNLIIDSLPLSNENEPPFNPNSKHNDEMNKFNNRKFKFGRIEGFIFDAKISPDDIVENGRTYSIFEFTTYDNFESENLCLRGYLPKDYKILMEIPLASMDEAMKITNMIFLIVGAMMLLIGIVIVTITSKTIAKPVKELSSIASAMQNLDFSKKYEHDRLDEIGSLGDSINALSEKLKSTIDELYEKNKRLEKDIALKSKIDKMRKDFIANASHELKTPIALISGYAEGLRDNVVTDEKSRNVYTEVIIEEAERMDSIIKQMLDLMEFDNTEDILDGTTFSVSTLVEDAISAFDVILKNRAITLEYDCDGECVAFGDYWRIHQVVTNYVSNAINHVNSDNLIKVSIKDMFDKIRVSVYNTGGNILEEDAINIWDRFYKADKAHTRAYGGTGLGLAIVKSIMEIHKGEYGFVNHIDGVEFYFTLNKEKIDEI